MTYGAAIFKQNAGECWPKVVAVQTEGQYSTVRHTYKVRQA